MSMVGIQFIYNWIINMAFVFGFIVLLNLFQNMWYLNIIAEFLSKPRVLLLLLYITQGIADVQLSRDLQPVLLVECFHSPS